MGLRLRGQAWYLRKNVGGERKEIPLGVYGGEANRRKAEKAASKVADRLSETQAGLSVLKHMNLTPAKPEGKAMTLAAWWVKYQEAHSPDKTEDTQQRDREIMAHWLPLLGDKPLDEIKQTDCKNGLARRRHSHTAHKNRKVKTLLTEDTIQRERRLLQAIFERAVEDNELVKNPWKGIGAPKGHKDATRSERILTEEDEVKLLAAMRTPVKDAVGKMVRMDERYPRFIAFMLETGLRIDELLNEHFSDKGTFVHVKGKFSKERDVALTSKARKTLDEQWADKGTEQSPRPEDGRPWWQIEQRFRGVMTKACERAGIRHLSPHDLRHSFGHRYLVKGGDIYDLSKILGHASVAVTEKHYGYLRPQDVHVKMLAVMEPEQVA